MAEKLRVVHVIPTLAKGGAERIAIDICNQLNKNPDIEVKLVSFANVNDYPSFTKEIDIHFIPSRYVPSLRGRAINEVKELRAFFDDFKPHVIHTHLFEAEIAARATEYFNALYVTHCHANMPQYRKIGKEKFTSKKLWVSAFERNLILKWVEKAKANVFLTISTDTKHFFDNNLPKELKSTIVLLFNAIDYKRFASKPLPTYPAEGQRFKLINVGSFSERKNQKLLIEIMSIVRNQSAAIDMVILGDGPDRPKILTEISKNTLELTTTAPGNVENVEVYLANSHLYIHTALYEPFGLVLVEAMAAGLPVIALDGKGNRDVNVEGKTGYLLPADASPEEFADKVISIVSNPELYKEMSVYARNFAAGFDIEAYTGKLLQEYKKLL
jgi:glycosyltransferase involved in cell wall biosynthesis